MDSKTQQALPKPIVPFSDCFRKVVIQLDPLLFPGVDSTIEWIKDASPAVSGGFEISRIGNKPCQVRITMYPDHSPARFKYSPELRALIGLTHETRAHALAAVHEYITSHHLLSGDQLDVVMTDHRLFPLLQVKSFRINELPALLETHLLPLDPLIFNHNIVLSGDSADSLSSYDTVLYPMLGAMAPPSKLATELHAVDEKVTAIDKKFDTRLQSYRTTQQEHDLFTAFSEAPIDTMKMLIATRARDYAAQHDKAHIELMRRTRFYMDDWLADAVDTHLAAVDNEHAAAVNAPSDSCPVQ
jgi:SWI/SNF-related matrix-associated actin-dependent regulator of chromatin subfamily D